MQCSVGEPACSDGGPACSVVEPGKAVQSCAPACSSALRGGRVSGWWRSCLQAGKIVLCWAADTEGSFMTDRLIDLAAAAVQRAQAAARNVQQTEAAAQAVSAGSQTCVRSTELVPIPCCICALRVKPSVTTLYSSCQRACGMSPSDADVVVLLVVLVACPAVGPGLHCGECAGRYPVHEGAALHRAAGTHSSPRFAAATAATGVWR